MKISELLKDKYKLRIPPTVYYDLLADVVEIEEQEPKTGRWIWNNYINERRIIIPYCKCSECGMGMGNTMFDYCPNCGAKMEVYNGDDD